MNAATILADVQLALALGQMAVQFGEEVGPYFVTAYQIAFQNKVLTDDERSAMRAKAADYRAKVDAVIAADDAAAAAAASPST